MSVGCARRDWVTNILVLADVSGTWTGYMNRAYGTGSSMALTLRQSGSSVTGEIAYGGSSGWLLRSGAVSGAVNGDVLSLNPGGMLGTFELTADEDEIV